ncbi:MAG: divalent metal cation transporter [Planctomycetia bacterium]|nr:divalent metal cation transporter [Planctomycetia bacterium]
MSGNAQASSQIAEPNASSLQESALPMSPKWDPEKLAQEINELNELSTSPFSKKVSGYLRRTGPGLLQSAMTLGAGSATASVLAGASFGYKLLWVQPVAMFLGVMMFAALSNIVLTTGERPYQSFGREFNKFLVFLWAFGTIFASVIWHFPQYTLLAGAARDLATLGGLEISNNGNIPGWVASLNEVLPFGLHINDQISNMGYLVSFGIGIFVLGMNIFMVFNYGKGATGVKIYERFLRTMIAIVIFFFLLVVIMNFQKIQWTELFKGLFGFYGFPRNAEGVVETSTYLQVLGMLGAAVGINMTFLYPYSLLAKGWGKEHRTLAKWDLAMTMLLPFAIVTSLIIISMTVTGVYNNIDGVREGMKPLDAAASFSGIPGGRAIFCLGLLGMCGGAISTHMVVCGFTMCEMLGIKMTQSRFRLFALTPAIGVLGVVIPLPLWFPVIASAICGIMLPIAYLIFLVLNNKRSFIGDAVGKGLFRWLHNCFLILALAATIFAAGLSINKLYVKMIAKPEPQVQNRILSEENVMPKSDVMSSEKNSLKQAPSFEL